MAVVNIPGVGRVNFPADMSEDQVQAAAQRLSAGVGINPRTGERDEELASIDRLITGTAEGREMEPTFADRLRSVTLDESLPLAGATMASIAAPGVGGAVARPAIQSLMAGAGGAAGGAAAESEDPDATAASIAQEAIESGGEMAMAELAGLGIGAVASRAIAPDLKFLDPLKGIREDIARYVGERWPKGQTASQMRQSFRRMSAAQREKLPKATRERIEELGDIAERIKKAGKFTTTPIGGEVAEMMAVPAVAMLFGPGAALALSVGKAALNPGPAIRYLTRDKLPGEATRAVSSQATRAGLRTGLQADESEDQSP